ncbi:MAG: flagellar biosynthesis regulator FlaF, partial [Alphaproteobacteria bacterium]
NQMLGARGYGATQRARSLQEQEADVFRRINYGLKAALNGDAIERARAVADNRRLWLAIEAVLINPENQLPETTRFGILRLGRGVQREMENQEPDIEFLININYQMIAGLSGDPG